MIENGLDSGGGVIKVHADGAHVEGQLKEFDERLFCASRESPSEGCGVGILFETYSGVGVGIGSDSIVSFRPWARRRRWWIWSWFHFDPQVAVAAVGVIIIPCSLRIAIAIAIAGISTWILHGVQFDPPRRLKHPFVSLKITGSIRLHRPRRLGGKRHIPGHLVSVEHHFTGEVDGAGVDDLKEEALSDGPVGNNDVVPGLVRVCRSLSRFMDLTELKSFAVHGGRQRFLVSCYIPLCICVTSIIISISISISIIEGLPIDFHSHGHPNPILLHFLGDPKCGEDGFFGMGNRAAAPVVHALNRVFRIFLGRVFARYLEGLVDVVPNDSSQFPFPLAVDAVLGHFDRFQC